jgi:hypothetical protein
MIEFSGVGGNCHVYESFAFYENQLSPLYVEQTATDFEMLPRTAYEAY